jgi:hypothetical protein
MDFYGPRALCTSSVMAASHGAIGGTRIFLGLLTVCWVGLPLLLLVALVWRLLRSLIASMERRLPAARAPDTDLMA